MVMHLVPALRLQLSFGFPCLWLLSFHGPVADVGYPGKDPDLGHRASFLSFVDISWKFWQLNFVGSTLKNDGNKFIYSYGMLSITYHSSSYEMEAKKEGMTPEIQLRNRKFVKSAADPRGEGFCSTIFCTSIASQY